MRLSRFLVVLIVFALCIPAEAQQPKKIPLIGYLSNSNRSGGAARSEGIRFALRERGYIEGQNITIQYRYADGKIDRYEETIGELVRLKVDILLVGGGDNIPARSKECHQNNPGYYDGHSRRSGRDGPG